MTENDRKILNEAIASFKEITGKEPANVFIDTKQSILVGDCGCRFEDEYSTSILLCAECSKLPCHNRDA